jgi:hypothetical protein
LTKEQAEKLLEIIEGTQDEGPFGEGWSSDELDTLRSLVAKTIREQSAIAEKLHNVLLLGTIHATNNTGVIHGARPDYCPATAHHYHVVEQLTPGGPLNGCTKCGFPIA